MATQNLPASVCLKDLNVEESVSSSVCLAVLAETENLPSNVCILAPNNTESLPSSACLQQQADTESIPSSVCLVVLANTETLPSSVCIQALADTESLPSSVTCSHEPVVTSITPAYGPVAGGTTITITGTDFQATGAGVTTVDIEGDLCTSVTVVNDTTITCVTPAHIAGEYDLSVNNDLGSDRLEDAFEYKFTGVIPAFPQPVPSERQAQAADSKVRVVNEWKYTILASSEADWTDNATENIVDISECSECYLVVKELDPGASRTLSLEVKVHGAWLGFYQEDGTALAQLSFSGPFNGIVCNGDVSVGGIKPFTIMGNYLRVKRSGSLLSSSYTIGVLVR